MQRFQSRHLFQLREIGLGLTCIGGFIDAYTFIQRGGVLAAGQTGNLIFSVLMWHSGIYRVC
ncbi:membrane protein [Lactiplantibacillus plantarum subsp. plantarum]|nr:membrane protein [Lactiplantibacillus plantarum subsp. plantarum]